MSEDFVNIEVDGVPMKARRGQMIIEITDATDVYVPRFCYHPKLSIAANCRMCLVEVERAPKPLPACATPVMEGMKVFTRSPRAIAAQQATMEFLLINHPLDCPICDQGGECELQDLAMGYGSDVSRFTERKRIVKDKNLGPLVSTDMTRCIHCTRCVRFGQEIAGIQELGTIGRGDRTEIGTYIEKSVGHELSGNIIDVCPVGALNNKPYRYRARAWEMAQHETISPHDCSGAQLFTHTLRGKVMRNVPRSCEEINETWAADRDRFGCHGLYAEDRLARPMVRGTEGEWRESSWEDALALTAEALQKVAPERAGFLAAPGATLEEHYLFAALARGLGSANIDHRLRRVDFSGQASDPVAPVLGLPIAAIDDLAALLVVGSALRREAPILAHRVRKAALRGAQVGFLNPAAFEWRFPVAAEIVAEAARLAESLAGILVAACDGDFTGLPGSLSPGNFAVSSPPPSSAPSPPRSPARGSAPYGSACSRSGIRAMVTCTSSRRRCAPAPGRPWGTSGRAQTPQAPALRASCPTVALAASRSKTRAWTPAGCWPADWRRWYCSDSSPRPTARPAWPRWRPSARPGSSPVSRLMRRNGCELTPA
jgi:NADH-quinone oxidoreductase subunit G